MINKPNLLVIDDDPSFCLLVRNFLKKQNFQVEEAHTAREGLRSVYEGQYALVLIDYRLPDLDGLELLKNIKKKFYHLPVIIMTNYANIRTAVNAMKHGAYEYVTKPINPDELLLTIHAALESASSQSHSLEDEPAKPAGGKTRGFMFVEGQSAQSAQVKKHIELVAPTNLSVIVQGESGTGKEYVSRLIHQKSKRANQPFVALDCGALSEELAASELFGHIKGAFTGAMQDKTGQFQAANGGTLFLDEIGNLSYDVQVKLLRAIQERTIRQVGGNKDITVDVRLIVATNENLDQAVKNGDFREDLYHRLNEFQIKVPSLRDRAVDIPLFVEHFLQQSNQELNKQVEGVEDEAMLKLQAYPWPGNIRELKNVIRRSVLLTTGEKITMDTFPPEIISPRTQEMFASTAETLPVASPTNPDLKALQEKNERALIEETLIKVRYNKTQAAKMLNIDRKTLYNKLRRYNLD
ncbi:MAG: sigma-54-dependent transcriptional regulator [Cyclobacteriaceae bacterium]